MALTVLCPCAARGPSISAATIQDRWRRRASLAACWSRLCGTCCTASCRWASRRGVALHRRWLSVSGCSVWQRRGMTRGEVYAALSQWRSRHAEASQLRRVVSRMVPQRTGRAYSSWVEAARERAYALDLGRRASSSGLRQDLAWASLCVPVPVRSGVAAFLHMLMLFWVRVGSACSLNLCFVRCCVCTCLCQGDGSRPKCQNSAFRT